MKSVLEYLENVKTNNLIIDENGSITYQELLIFSKKIGSGLGKFVKKSLKESMMKNILKI